VSHAWWARRFHFFTITMRHPVYREWRPAPHINNINPTDTARRPGRRATTLRRVRDISSIDEVTQQTINTAQLYMRDANQIRNSNPQHFFLLLRIPLSFLRVCTLARSTTMQTGKLGCIAALEGPPGLG
jgi:hypothetical protein